MLHDRADPGRCALVLPNASDPSQKREHHFHIKRSPQAMVITDDNKRLVFVTIERKHALAKYQYILRSRTIFEQEHILISDRDVVSEHPIFEVKKEVEVSITVLTQAEGYVVLAALATGHVRSAVLV